MSLSRPNNHRMQLPCTAMRRRELIQRRRMKLYLRNISNKNSP